MQGTCDEEIKVFKLIVFSCFISDTSVLIYSFRLIKNFSSFNRNNIHELIFGSFCRYRKALYFWSLGISLYLELFCFLSFITIVLRNLCSGTHRRNLIFLLNLEGSWAVSLFFLTYHWILFHGKYI